MKTSKIQKNAPLKTSSSKSFFKNKKGRNFFSNSTKSEKPFFSPNPIQRKSEKREGEDQLQRKEKSKTPDIIRLTPLPSNEIQNLPQDLVTRMREAVANRDPVLRQSVIDELVALARVNLSVARVQVNWSNISSVLYVPTRSGSQTFTQDLSNIRIEFGVEPFLNIHDLYSVFLHDYLMFVIIRIQGYAPSIFLVPRRIIRKSGLTYGNLKIWNTQD